MKPIIFSTPMVRAILDGRKTMTRRVMTPQPQIHMNGWLWEAKGILCWWPYNDTTPPHAPVMSQARKYTAGELLYVRETFARCGCGDFWFRADTNFTFGDNVAYCPGCDDILKWRPSIHMPRALSRITLRILDVRVERVQDISGDDAIAEGIDMESEFASLCINIEDAWYQNDLPHNSAILAVFRYLWDGINAKRGYGWDASPWVWAIRFEVVSE